jgi:hypothetical protein
VIAWHLWFPCSHIGYVAMFSFSPELFVLSLVITNMCTWFASVSDHKLVKIIPPLVLSLLC